MKGQCKSDARERRANERGAALFTAIFGVLLVTALATSLFLISENARRSAANYAEGNEAFYIAEAGLSHAIGLFSANGQSYAINSVIPASGTGLSFGKGHYTVQASDAAQPNSKLITSTGRGQNGSTATVEAIIKFNTSNASDAAIVVNGNVTINGNLQVLGAQGVIHANGTMTLTGNNRAEKYYSATGSISRPGNQPCPNGSVNGAPPGCAAPDFRANQEVKTVPDIKPSDFFNQADYRLYPQSGSTPARITDKLGNVIATNCQSGCWGGWTWNSGQGWVINSSSNLPTGTYYAVQSSLEVNRTFGSSTSPLGVSFIAEGSVSFSSGASYMTSKATLGGRKFAVVAGDDVSVQGANLNTTNAESTFYARDQFNLAGGQPKVHGNIFVYNENDVAAYGQNKVQRQGGQSFLSSGDPQVTFNGNNASTGNNGPNTIESWREIRN